MHSTFLLLSAYLLGMVKAAPASHGRTKGCDVSKDDIPLPSAQTNLTVPTDAKPLYIASGTGTQNYSCSAAGTYTSIGAVAKLYDASCVYNEIASKSEGLSAKDAQTAAKGCLGSNPVLLGHHYFVPNPVAGGTGLSPKFDFTSDSQKGHPDAFVVTAKAGDILAPQDSKDNVDWLELKAVAGQGDLAKYVFRINTAGGQPPPSCTPGSAPIAVPYTANYWLYK